MKLQEAKENINKEAFLPDGEKVVIIKIVGGESCMALGGPELDKYTYVQLKDLVSSKEKELSRCLLSEIV